MCPLRMRASAGCATEMATHVGWDLPEMVRAKAFLPAGKESAGKDRSWKLINLEFLKDLAGVGVGVHGLQVEDPGPKGASVSVWIPRP